MVVYECGVCTVPREQHCKSVLLYTDYTKIPLVCSGPFYPLLKGKIFRVATLGFASTFDAIIAVSGIEMTLKELGADIELGKGVAAAQKILFEM